MSTALHDAVAKINISEVQNLLASDAELVHQANDDGQLPLYYAAYLGNAEIISLLLAAHSPVNAVDKWRRTPLYIASANGHADVVGLLLRHGADPNITTLLDEDNARDPGIETPLHAAVRMGYVAVIQLLIDHGADIEINNGLQQTPEAYARTWGKNAIADMIVQWKSSTV